MDNLKPFEKIASRFQISHESAKYFLGRVQKSFKIEKPPHKLIVEFMETQEFEFLLTPYELAAMRSVWPSCIQQGTLVRFSVGLEAAADLQADLAHALAQSLC